MNAATVRDAVSKLRRIRRVQRAQAALDTEIGQLAIVKHMGRPMDADLKAKLENFAARELWRAGHAGVTVEVIYHPEKRLVEFAAHAEDRR